MATHDPITPAYRAERARLNELRRNIEVVLQSMQALLDALDREPGPLVGNRRISDQTPRSALLVSPAWTAAGELVAALVIIVGGGTLTALATLV